MKRIWALICILFVAPFIAFAWITWASKATGFGVSPAEANAAIHQRFAVPASARDVCFVSTPWYSNVTFLVEPDDFHAWLRSRGFRATAIKPAVTFALDVSGAVRYDVDAVAAGVSFKGPGRLGIFGVYDPGRRLCCASFSAH